MATPAERNTKGKCHKRGKKRRVLMIDGSPAKEIYRRRTKLNLSQERLARLAIVSTKSVWSIEDGRDYSSRIMDKILEALNILERKK